MGSRVSGQGLRIRSWGFGIYIYIYICIYIYIYIYPGSRIANSREQKNENIETLSHTPCGFVTLMSAVQILRTWGVKPSAAETVRRLWKPQPL